LSYYILRLILIKDLISADIILVLIWIFLLIIILLSLFLIVIRIPANLIVFYNIFLLDLTLWIWIDWRENCIFVLMIFTTFFFFRKACLIFQIFRFKWILLLLLIFHFLLAYYSFWNLINLFIFLELLLIFFILINFLIFIFFLNFLLFWLIFIIF
jgi:hypothetical protein